MIRLQGTKRTYTHNVKLASLFLYVRCIGRRFSFPLIPLPGLFIPAVILLYTLADDVLRRRQIPRE